MRCEEIRPLLPELAEGAPRAVGPVQEHLAGCAACSAELAAYRSVLTALRELRDDTVTPPDGSLERMLAQIPEAHRRRLLARVAGEGRSQHAALSLGGAVVGATAIGLLWWRAARRGGPPGAAEPSRKVRVSI